MTAALLIFILLLIIALALLAWQLGKTTGEREALRFELIGARATLNDGRGRFNAEAHVRELLRSLEGLR